ADARHRVREVGLARRDELLGALLGHDRERDPLGLDRRHLAVVEALEAAVDADEGRRADLEVDVGRAALGCVREQLIEIEHADEPPLQLSARLLRCSWIGTGAPGLKPRCPGISARRDRAAPSARAYARL